MFKIRLFTFATCLTLSGVVLPALALELSIPLNNSNNSNNSKSSLDRSDLNFYKTRPEFAQPDLRNPIPLINSSPSPASTSTPTMSPGIIPIAPANPIPGGGAGAQGLGDRPIIPTINTLPGANRPEFQVPDLRLPSSPNPSPNPSPSPM